MADTKEISAIDRVFEAAECRTQIALAELLGIKQSSISFAKRKGTIPADWLIKLLRLKGINPEWILTGLGSKNLVPTNGEPATHLYLSETKPPEECSTQDLVNELVRRALSKL